MQFLKKRMAEHVKGTYLLFCGKNSQRIGVELERMYSNLNFDDHGEGFINGKFYWYFDFVRLFDKITMANLVQEKVLNPYNVYHPIITPNEPAESIDFNDSDFTWIKNEK